MTDTKEKKPDYVIIGLIALLVSVFVGGQWLVLTTLDARIGTLETTLLQAIEHGPRPSKDKDAKPAATAMGTATSAPTMAPSAMPSASAMGSASAMPSASAAPKKP